MTRKEIHRLRFKAKSRRHGDCIIWIGARTIHGYGTFRLYGKNVIASRAAWRLFVGPIPRGKSVLHRCDRKACVKTSHLFIGTQQDNIDDMWRKGRQQDYASRRENYCQGEDHGMVKITKRDVLTIRRSKKTCVELAAIYGLGDSTISRIKNRKLWRTL